MDVKGTLDMITKVDFREMKASIQLDVEKVAALIKTEISKLDLEFLHIEEFVGLYKRTNGTKQTTKKNAKNIFMFSCHGLFLEHLFEPAVSWLY